MVDIMLHRKLKIEQHEPHIKPGAIPGGLKGYPVPAPTSGTRRVAIDKNPVVSHEWGHLLKKSIRWKDKNKSYINGAGWGRD